MLLADYFLARECFIWISCLCSSLGRPRRFSEHFLKEEKEKLNQYRESVRTHYAELHAGTREGLPTDLARPLSVQQSVIAIHPRTREIQNGTVLTVDVSRYRVQFDQPALGVDYVRVILFSRLHLFLRLLFIDCLIKTMQTENLYLMFVFITGH